MKVSAVVILAIVSVTIIGCTMRANAKDLKFTKDNEEQVLEAVKKSKDLTGEEVGLLMAAVVRDALTGSVLEGKTVGQVIDEQRKILAEAEAKEREQKRLAEEARKKEEALIAELLKHLTVTVYEKGFQEANIYSGVYQDKITFKIAMHNKSERPIRAFRGTVVFKDLFGTEIDSIGLSYDTGLGQGKKKNETYTIDYNQFMDRRQRLRSTALANMKVEWRPKTILFADGTKLGE